MKMTFRWYGTEDPIPLRYIRQIPVVKGIVSALYNVPVGDEWPLEKIAALKKSVEAEGLELTVIESIPVHEDIKLGLPTRDGFIENYCRSIRNMGSLGIPILCYNFMPVFDWMRSDLSLRLADGSTALAYDHDAIAAIDLNRGVLDLPGWATSYNVEALRSLLDAYTNIGPGDLWSNLEYFLKRVVPVAEESDVRMGIHPDDPPWSIFGLPRIITDEAALERLTGLVDSPSNGITFCTGSLGPNIQMNLTSAMERFVRMRRVPFVHARNIRRTGEKKFHETAHCTDAGDLDMYRVIRLLAEAGFDGAIRPDHGRMIWGEKGRPGYGLYDRALGAMYLAGLWEASVKSLDRSH
ncbi:MAG TPA: mannonate dehydratase [Spirochaetota bacterium]|nr:mannonate dehydratase [Spirochaetota bacterium]